jgi:hypothetical protein
MDERRAAAAEAAAAMVVAAMRDDYDGAVEVLAAPGVDARLVAIELAAIAAKALRQAYGDQAYDAAGRQLARARQAGVKTAITWHRDGEPGMWHAKAGGWRIATAWTSDIWSVGYPGHYVGEIYGETKHVTTLREFKALVAKAYAERERA